MDEMISSIGTQSLLYIVITLLCILISWWALRMVRWDIFMKDIKSTQSKLLQVIIAVVVGYQLGQFFINYLNWSSYIRQLF